MNWKTWFAGSAAILLNGMVLHAEMAESFTVNSVYGSHMVLQQGSEIVIAGTAAPGSELKVAFDQKTVTVKTAGNGKWKAKFPALKAGGPHKVVVSGGKTADPVEFNDVQIGEVWMCSGQSNMQMPVNARRAFWRVKNAAQEVKNANHPGIRIFQVALKTSPYAEQEQLAGGKWEVCSPDTIAKFSAAAYFFGRQLNRDLKVPVGLINASWGGTRIEPWISRRKFVAEKRGEAKTIANAIMEKNKPGKKETANSEIAIQQRRLDLWVDTFLVDMEIVANQTFKNIELNQENWKNAKADDIELVGTAWYRRNIVVPKEWAGQDLIVYLGVIDDCDDTYFNAVKIGSTTHREKEHWAKKRYYTIPGKLVKAGKNVMAIHVFNYYGTGGINSLSKDIYIRLKKNSKAPRISIANDWKMKTEFVADTKKLGQRPAIPNLPKVESSQFPSTLFNAMIRPWTEFPIRGVIWYQGCSNAGSPDYYPLHKYLIQDWRAQWKNPAMPFLVTQLAGFQRHTPKNRLADNFWTEIPADKAITRYAMTREIQAEMTKIPNVGLAVAMDIGDHSDIHPGDKQTLGYRLAMMAEKIAYGKKNAAPGPSYQSMKIEGGKIRIFFANTGKGLTTKDGKAPGAFMIAGSNRKYVWAKAEIDPANNTVLVSSDQVKEPKNVRYAFVQYRGDVNLCSKDGFPAIPFRTDKPDYR